MLTILGDGVTAGLLERGLTPPVKPVTILLADAPADKLFDQAVRSVDRGDRLIILSFRTPAMLAGLREYQLAKTYPLTRFERLPLTYIGVQAVINEELSDVPPFRPDNQLVRAVLSLPVMRTNLLSTAKHDLGHALKAPVGSERQRDMENSWQGKARELFGEELSREELLALVNTGATISDGYAPLARQETYSCLCCDIEGTLIDSEGSLNRELLAYLNEQAAIRPVTLWTGGDMKRIDSVLRLLEIDLPLIPKQLLRGVTVSEVVDDEGPAVLREKYGVQIADYRPTI